MTRVVHVALLATLTVGCAPTSSPQAFVPQPVTPPTVVTSPLVVASDLPMTDYSRARFGTSWKDVDGNGCDQRFDVLIRDATGAETNQRPGAPATPPCKVTVIMLTDPYTGQVLRSTGDIDIDHVVPLAAAWRAGAARWTDAERERFANDTTNLLAVHDRVNRAKGDQTPDRWLPPSSSEHCRYARIYSEVSSRYGLAVSSGTAEVLTRLRETCHPR